MRRPLIITDYLSKRDVETLLCAMDVYVSLHRAEGFGYTLAEAMLLGVPGRGDEILGQSRLHDGRRTRTWSPAAKFRCTSREGPFETGTVWAEPDIDHAVAILRQIHG